MENGIAKVTDLGTPVIAVALHAGSYLRDELQENCILEPEQRRREEDPYTDYLGDIGVSTIVASRSRFEVDLNRHRKNAVYSGPEDAWGLMIWGQPLTESMIEESMKVYDEFYRVAENVLDAAIEKHGRIVVLDLHSYNHRRDGILAPPANPTENPDVNVGTRSVDSARWASVVSAFNRTFADAGFDVRENVKFKGGHFPTWVNERYLGRGCALAIELKKSFMDEWTGKVDMHQLERRKKVLTQASRAIENTLASMEPVNSGIKERARSAK